MISVDDAPTNKEFAESLNADFPLFSRVMNSVKKVRLSRVLRVWLTVLVQGPPGL